MKQIAASIIFLILGFLLGYIVNSQTNRQATLSNKPIENNNISSFLNLDYRLGRNWSHRQHCLCRNFGWIPQTKIFQSLYRCYQQVDPAAGLKWALNLDSKYRQITEMAVRSIQSHNVDAAESMLFSIEDLQLKQLMLTRIAQNRAQGDPQSALH